MSIRTSIVIKCVDEAHLFFSWGLEKKKGRTFRPAMQLSTGELASLGGITVLQTATATRRTMMMLEAEFPEVSSWKKILNIPYRSNITIIVPPSSILSSRYQDQLAPFIKRILDYDEPHLIIVRSINSGTEIYFYLLKMLGSTPAKKTVAFYHRNSSEKRQKEILHDLSLPLDNPNKKLRAIVATISLGVGVDIRVKNVVCMGLAANPENLIQEAGRCLRGSQQTSNAERGFAFFFQKGTVAAIHCPPGSDCRSLIMDPLPKCQTRCLYQYFDTDFHMDITPCQCCYSCISMDAKNGCRSCVTFLETYLPQKVSKAKCSSLKKGLKAALLELFEGLGISTIEVETRLSLDVDNFTSDFIKIYDEIDCPSAIQSLWHIPEELANDLFEVSSEFLEGDATLDEDNDEDPIDESADQDISDTDTISTNHEMSLSDDSEEDIELDDQSGLELTQ